ncbi:MAG: hypothetical protein GC204_06940 [Chloroflexi bacterium]|nr:hypothetical protein [Chloroflexota bacterium]
MMYTLDDKAKLEAARTLIKQKEFDLAARLLRTMDHPTAREWLEEIEAAKSRKRKREYPLRVIAVILLIVIVALVGAGAIFQGNDPRQAVVELPTQAALDTATPTWTPTASFTPSITPTPSDTSTPTATSTFTPSATNTATQTFTPSMTITFTRTPGPTATFAASSTPIAIRPLDPTLYTVSAGTATLYLCPRVDCEVAAKLTRSDNLMVVGDIQGQAVVGNTLWYSAFFGDVLGYIHSSMVEVKPLGSPTQSFPTLALEVTPEATASK